MDVAWVLIRSLNGPCLEAWMGPAHRSGKQDKGSTGFA